MQAYALHDLYLVLEAAQDESLNGLERLLQDLNFARDGLSSGSGAVRMSVSLGISTEQTHHHGTEVLNVDGIQGFESDTGFWLGCESASASIEVDPVVAKVRTTPDFFTQSPLFQRNFWSFVLMKLLRLKGVFTLHAAALVSPQGRGLLIVASPGSGKSTLAIGLVKRGWHYLSDDAVLLRSNQTEIEALALRKHFFVDAEAYDRYVDLAPGVVCEDAQGAGRHRLDMRRVFPDHYLSACTPSHVLFPQIVSRAKSETEPVTKSQAMNLLLHESGPQLFDKRGMPEHLSILRALIEQCELIRLHSGRDLLDDPGLLESYLGSSSEWPRGAYPC